MVQLAPHRGSQSDDHQPTDVRSVSQSAQHWSTPVGTLLEQPPSSLPLRLAIGGIAFSVCFGFWAWFGQVNEVARAQGKLIPKGEVYKVNLVTSGKVARVLVQEGKPIQSGQVMLELDTELARQESDRIEKELSAARIELGQMRILLSQVRSQAQTRLDIAHAAAEAQTVQIAQARSTITTTQEILDQLRTDADAQKARREKFQPLVAVGAIAQEQVFQVEQGLRERERTITEHTGTLKQHLAEVDRLQVELAQKQAEQKELQQQSQQEVQQLQIKVAQGQAKIDQLVTELAMANAKLRQQFLYAPTSGIVSALNVHHPGEVVQSGQPIAEIAPNNRPLVLSALLPNQEAGFVKVGMPVQLKFDAFPYQEHGMVSGKVIHLSPDAQPNERLGQVYRVEVQLDRNSVTKDNQQVALKAGQTATAEIVTRHRQVIDLLLDPLKKLQSGVNL
ncbi:MAG: secretion protein HlyD [Leptolyngbya sp. ERB_1_1]